MGHDSSVCTGEDVEQLESDNTYNKVVSHVPISHVATMNVSQARGIGVSRKMCVRDMIHSFVFMWDMTHSYAQARK